MDAKQFAVECRNGRGFNPCKTCSNPEVNQFIHAVMETWADGKGESNYNALHRHLREHHGYTIGYTGMMKHINSCEENLADRIRNGS